MAEDAAFMEEVMEGLDDGMVVVPDTDETDVAAALERLRDELEQTRYERDRASNRHADVQRAYEEADSSMAEMESRIQELEMRLIQQQRLVDQKTEQAKTAAEIADELKVEKEHLERVKKTMSDKERELRAAEEALAAKRREVEEEERRLEEAALQARARMERGETGGGLSGLDEETLMEFLQATQESQERVIELESANRSLLDDLDMKDEVIRRLEEEIALLARQKAEEAQKEAAPASFAEELASSTAQMPEIGHVQAASPSEDVASESRDAVSPATETDQLVGHDDTTAASSGKVTAEDTHVLTAQSQAQAISDKGQTVAGNMQQEGDKDARQERGVILDESSHLQQQSVVDEGAPSQATSVSSASLSREASLKRKESDIAQLRKQLEELRMEADREHRLRVEAEEQLRSAQKTAEDIQRDIDQREEEIRWYESAANLSEKDKAKLLQKQKELMELRDKAVEQTRLVEQQRNSLANKKRLAASAATAQRKKKVSGAGAGSKAKGGTRAALEPSNPFAQDMAGSSSPLEMKKHRPSKLSVKDEKLHPLIKRLWSVFPYFEVSSIKAALAAHDGDGRETAIYLRALCRQQNLSPKLKPKSQYVSDKSKLSATQRAQGTVSGALNQQGDGHSKSSGSTAFAAVAAAKAALNADLARKKQQSNSAKHGSTKVGAAGTASNHTSATAAGHTSKNRPTAGRPTAKHNARMPDEKGAVEATGRVSGLLSKQSGDGDEASVGYENFVGGQQATSPQGGRRESRQLHAALGGTSTSATQQASTRQQHDEAKENASAADGGKADSGRWADKPGSSPSQGHASAHTAVKPIGDKSSAAPGSQPSLAQSSVSVSSVTDRSTNLMHVDDGIQCSQCDEVFKPEPGAVTARCPLCGFKHDLEADPEETTITSTTTTTKTVRKLGSKNSSTSEMATNTDAEQEKRFEWKEQQDVNMLTSPLSWENGFGFITLASEEDAFPVKVEGNDDAVSLGYGVRWTSDCYLKLSPNFVRLLYGAKHAPAVDVPLACIKHLNTVGNNLSMHCYVARARKMMVLTMETDKADDIFKILRELISIYIAKRNGSEDAYLELKHRQFHEKTKKRSPSKAPSATSTNNPNAIFDELDMEALDALVQDFVFRETLGKEVNVDQALLKPLGPYRLRRVLDKAGPETRKFVQKWLKNRSKGKLRNILRKKKTEAMEFSNSEYDPSAHGGRRESTSSVGAESRAASTSSSDFQMRVY